MKKEPAKITKVNIYIYYTKGGVKKEYKVQYQSGKVQTYYQKKPENVAAFIVANGYDYGAVHYHFEDRSV